MATTNTTPTITEAQLNRCHRIEGPDGVFYQVESETDPDKEYIVKAIKDNGQWFITCNCPHGEKGGNCKHKRWSKAHAEWYKTQEKRLEVVERFPFPRSTTVAYTLSDGAEVIRFGNGVMNCGCRQFCEETGPEHLTRHHCKHLEVVQRHLQEVLEEMAQYLHETVTGR